MRKRILYTVVPNLECGPAPVALVRETRNSNDYIRKTRNHGYVLLQYTLSGKGLLTTGNHSYNLPHGTLFICDVNDPGYSYRYHPESTAPWEFLFIKIKGESFRLWTRNMNMKFGYIYHLPIEHSLIQNCLGLLKHNWTSNIITASEGIRMCANIQSALLESKEHNESNKVKSRIVNDSIVLIQERTALPITAQDIAECLEISREHLTRIFKDQLGVTPYRFIVNMKMEKAKHELIQSDTPIKEIAYDLGFSSPELFTQVFKREYKLTPKQFRATYSI